MSISKFVTRWDKYKYAVITQNWDVSAVDHKLTEFNGKPVLQIGLTGFHPMSFGIYKARAIVRNWPLIQRVADSSGEAVISTKFGDIKYACLECQQLIQSREVIEQFANNKLIS